MNEYCARPWGSWEVLSEGPGYKVKKLIVDPKQNLSKQLHHHREEFWVVIEGKGEVIFQTDAMREAAHWPLRAGDRFFVSKKEVHQLINTSPTEKLIIIEVQRGEILSEDDIERLDGEPKDPVESVIKELEK